MDNKALAIYQQFDQIQKAALVLHKSGYFKDSQSEAQAIVKVMAGAELGLPPFASMNGFNIIQGKVAPSANIIATLVKNDPRYDYRIKRATIQECTLTWFENGKEVGEASFTWKEAETVKQWNKKKNAWESLTSKQTWKSYPSDMLFARAMTRGARRFAPGIFGGSPVYTPEELGADVDQEGNVIDITPEVLDPKPKITRVEATQPDPDLDPEPQDEKPNGNDQRLWDPPIVKAIIADGAPNGFHAVGRLNLSNLDNANVTEKIALAWHDLYKSWRDGTGLEAKEAAANANAGKKYQPEAEEGE